MTDVAPPLPYRILVTGWRDWPARDSGFIYRKLWVAVQAGIGDKRYSFPWSENLTWG